MQSARSTGRTPAKARAPASFELICPKGRSGLSVIPSAPPWPLDCSSSQRSLAATYTSYATMIPALPNRPRPRIIRKNFRASMVLSFLSYFLERQTSGNFPKRACRNQKIHLLALASPLISLGYQPRALTKSGFRRVPIGGCRLHEGHQGAQKEAFERQGHKQRHQGGNHQTCESKHRVHLRSPLWSGKRPSAFTSWLVCGREAHCVACRLGVRARRARRGAENLRDFIGAFRDYRDAVSDFQAHKQFLDLAIAQANAAVGGVVANGIGAVGAVDAEALDVQAHPARAEWIARAGFDDHAGAVVGWILEALGDLELAARALARRRADGDVVDFHDPVFFHQGKFAIRDADDDATRGVRR